MTTFRALASPNYRIWVAGALVSNIGTWMQRTAQDWVVLTQLTRHNAAAVGIVVGLQFGPQVLLLPVTGYVADHFDRRSVLFATQSAMGLLALGLGLLSLSGTLALWHVYLFALMLGCASAFDSPTRQTFVSELVDKEHLSNAVGLNSTSFNLGRMVGPALAGLLIAHVGSGWVFILNALSFGGTLLALTSLKVDRLHRVARSPAGQKSVAEGFRYIAGRPDLLTVMVMIFLVGTFALNFPIFISTMSVIEFHVGADRFGALMSMMAIGSVTGALLAARRRAPHIGFLVGGVWLFCIGFATAVAMPSYFPFGLALVLVGVAAQTVTTTANSVIQLSTAPAMRGRVVAIFLALALGGAPLGGPLVGWVANVAGPRWAMGVGGIATLVAGLIGLRYLRHHRALRFAAARWGISASLAPAEPLHFD